MLCDSPSANDVARREPIVPRDLPLQRLVSGGTRQNALEFEERFTRLFFVPLSELVSDLNGQGLA